MLHLFFIFYFFVCVLFLSFFHFLTHLSLFCIFFISFHFLIIFSSLASIYFFCFIFASCDFSFLFFVFTIINSSFHPKFFEILEFEKIQKRMHKIRLSKRIW